MQFKPLDTCWLTARGQVNGPSFKQIATEFKKKQPNNKKKQQTQQHLQQNSPIYTGGTRLSHWFSQSSLLKHKASYAWKTISGTDCNKLFDLTAKYGCSKMPELSRPHNQSRLSIKSQSKGTPGYFFIFFYALHGCRIYVQPDLRDNKVTGLVTKLTGVPQLKNTIEQNRTLPLEGTYNYHLVQLPD